MNAANRPIQTTRGWYETTRRSGRENEGPRVERGLPQHPDGSGFAPCPRCGADGIIESEGWVHPDLIKSRTCTACFGSGLIEDGYRDPLLRLRDYRRHRESHALRYAWTRRLVMTPCLQLRLIESKSLRGMRDEKLH
jgi:hypothetical protein